jgi:hypothetical protein
VVAVERKIQVVLLLAEALLEMVAQVQLISD